MVKRKIVEPVIEPKVFSNIHEIEAGIMKLNRRIEDVRDLDPQHIRYDDQIINNVESSIRETIRDVFGQNSPEFHDHQYDSIWDGGHRVSMSEMENQGKSRGRFELARL